MTKAEEAGIKPEAKKLVTLKLVIFYDDEGNYLVHGDSKSTPPEMIKAMTPLWDIDPTCETMRYLEVRVALPTISELPKIRTYAEH